MKAIRQDAKSNVLLAQEKQKEQYDRKHCHLLKYRVGDSVLKKDFCRKKQKGGCMDFKWLGPYEIIKDVGKGFYALKNQESGRLIERIHGAHLKMYNTQLISPQSKVSWYCLYQVLTYMHMYTN